MGAFARPPIFSPPLAPLQPHSPSLIIGCSSSRLCRAHPQQGRPDDDGRAADRGDHPPRTRCAQRARPPTHPLGFACASPAASTSAHCASSHVCGVRAGTVPDEIKSELLQRIRRFAEQQS